MKPTEFKKCVNCLHQVGYGVSRISKITGVNKGLASKWLKKFFNYTPRSGTDVCRRLTAKRMANKPLKPQKIKKVRLKKTDEEKAVSKQKHNQLARIRAFNRYNKFKNDPNFMADHRRRLKEWRGNNKAKVKVWQNRWRRVPANKIGCNLRRRVSDLIHFKSRVLSTEKLIGCKREFMVQWFENQFTKGMSWDNYGDWHVDHIVPCSAFDLNREDQQRVCFHYSNLRPLWAADNMQKSDKVIPCQPEFALSLAD